MSAILKIAATGIVAALCALMLGKQAPELSMVLAISGAVVVLASLSGTLETVTGFVNDMTEKSGLAQGVVRPVLKITGIAMVTRLSADFCRDAKETSLASAVEMAGSVVALVAVIPLMDRVLDLLADLL